MADPIINDPFQAIVGVKASVVVASFFGGVVSAMLQGGSILQRTVTAVVGCVTSVYLTPFAIAYVSPYLTTVSTPQLEHASAFMCGLLGMSISQGLYNIGRTFRRRPMDVIGRIKPQA
ncbi:hypothetical protein ACD578_05490 [Microvirga sp. RSM25]|uniref:hypothetical protein n=1 Tax=Microvirga sp. RSM25 TaxID=3273802 RepID=UPI003850F0FD